MRIVLVISVALALVASGLSNSAQAQGKGGGKGGGRGRPSFAGPKFSQPARNFGGSEKPDKFADKPDKLADKPDKLADKPGKLADKPKDSLDKLASKKDGLTDPETFNKKQKQLDIEQRNRDKRLAQADHLREIAERTGNQNLAANADRMEAFAHDHYARRVEQLEKFGVSDPTLDSALQPLLDPAGEFPAIPLLP